MSPLTDEDIKKIAAANKEAHKEALKEWLDERFVLLGKWSMGAFVAMALAALTYFILRMNGWSR